MCEPSKLSSSAPAGLGIQPHRGRAPLSANSDICRLSGETSWLDGQLAPPPPVERSPSGKDAPRQLFGIGRRTTVEIAIAAGLSWWPGNPAGLSGPVLPRWRLSSRSKRTALKPSAARSAGWGRAGWRRHLFGALAFFRPSAVVLGWVVVLALLVDRLIRLISRIGVDTKNQSAMPSRCSSNSPTPRF
jgi:hypothetical protein